MITYKFKINFKNPKTELDYLILCSELWHDIYINKYTDKSESKYYKYIYDFTGDCPLCEYNELGCKTCILSDSDNDCIHYWKYYQNKDIKAAKTIYTLCLNRIMEILHSEEFISGNTYRWLSSSIKNFSNISNLNKVDFNELSKYGD